MISILIFKNIMQVIILDEGLTRPIGLIATYSLLREHNVKEVFILNTGKLSHFREKVKNVIFITRPFLTHMDMICDNIHKYVCFVTIYYSVYLFIFSNNFWKVLYLNLKNLYFINFLALQC